MKPGVRGRALAAACMARVPEAGSGHACYVAETRNWRTQLDAFGQKRSRKQWRQSTTN
jgi:hypothetical protein